MLTHSHPLSLPFLLVLLLWLSLFCSICTALPQQSNQAASTQYTSDTAFQNAILNVTNVYRKQHNASALVWNSTLAEYAGKWIGACEFKHSGGPYGENLASGYANASASVDAWGNEETKYDFGHQGFGESTGHFTQLVWKATKQVGCARKDCNGGQQGGSGDAPGWYVACEYYPAGNVIGNFTDNVQPEVKSGAVREIRSSLTALWIAVFFACLIIGML